MTIESLSTEQSPTPDALLAELADCSASGVLEITHPGDAVSHVWVRDGRIYAMQVPGYRPALGIRLLSGGLISPEQLSAAAAEQRERFPADLIGEVLVGMGLVSTEIIDAFVRDQVLDQVADLLDLPILDTAFHPGRRVQNDVIVPTPVDELLAVAQERRANRADVLALVGGPDTVPTLVPLGQGSTQTPLGPYDWALLCRVDGRRDITELARVCGYTVHEAAQMVADLTMTGLLVLPEPADAPDEPLAPVVALRPDAPLTPPEPQWHFDGTDAGEPEPMGDLLAELSAFAHEEPGGPSFPVAPPDLHPDVTLHPEVTLGTDATPQPEVTLPPDPEPVEPSLSEPPVPVEPDAPPAWAQPGADTMPDDPTRDTIEASADTEPVEPASPVAADVPAPEAFAAEEPPADAHPAPATPMFPPGAPVAPPPDQPGYSDTSVFMRELSSLSDDVDESEPVVTRMVLPFTEPRRKRRFWNR